MISEPSRGLQSPVSLVTDTGVCHMGRGLSGFPENGLSSAREKRAADNLSGIKVLILSDGFTLGLAPSPLRAQWAALKVFRSPSLDHLEPLVLRLLKRFFLKRPGIVCPSPAWDLPLFLGALQQSHFESLDIVELKCLTLKVLFLVAIASAKCSWELVGSWGHS